MFILWYSIFVLITNPDRWELEYISLHAILMKKCLGMRRFFFFVSFTLWKTRNERHCISMLVIYYTGQCIWKVKISPCSFFNYAWYVFWEKLLTNIWIGMMKCHNLFDGNKSDFLLLQFLYMVLQVCMILNDMHL